MDRSLPQVTETPLRRNRDFVLLQVGQLLSSAGTQLTTIAYPLLVLTLTHSPAKAGLVAFARAVPLVVFALPAGVAADRWSRRKLMIGTDLVRACGVGALATLLALDRAPFWVIPVVAVVEGCGAALFSAAEAGALRAVVPIVQLPAAAATQTGRRAVVQLVGPPVGGALFSVARALPFVADAASYTFSSASLLLMRTPFEEPRSVDDSSVRARVAEGMRFLWSRPFLRTCALLFGLGNFIGPGLLFCVVVVGKQHGMSSTAVGALVASFGGCVAIGSLVSPLVRRHLPVRAVILLELWAWVGCAVFLARPTPVVLIAGILPAALVIASTDSVVHGYRLAMTPDRLLGRSEAARTMVSLSIAPLGPLIAGLLLDRSARATVGLFAAAALALAVWGTASPAIRRAPALEELGSEPSGDLDGEIEGDASRW